MTLRKTLYLTYLASIGVILGSTMYFVELMIFDQKTADIVILAVLSTTVILSLVNYFVIKPVLKIIFQLQETSQKNASGEFITIKNDTFIKEVSMLLEDYNQMVNQLEKQVKQIKQVEQEKSEMISNLSHDIKTPVSSLIVLGQALHDDILDQEERTYYLEAVLDNCYRISDLSNELFQVVESGNISVHLEKSEIWIDEILIKVLNVFKGKIDQTKRDIFIVGAENKRSIYSDESFLFRIFCNVIDNALKYSQPGTPIRIEVIERDELLEICISDQGKGISKKEQEYIFKRTYRVEKSRNTETGGNGLGLAINQQLLQHIGGTISVESELEQGSTFFIKIPYNFGTNKT